MTAKDLPLFTVRKDENAPLLGRAKWFRLVFRNLEHQLANLLPLPDPLDSLLSLAKVVHILDDVVKLESSGRHRISQIIEVIDRTSVDSARSSTLGLAKGPLGTHASQRGPYGDSPNADSPVYDCGDKII